MTPSESGSGDALLMSLIILRNTSNKTRWLMCSTALLSAVLLVGCNNTKPVDLAKVPTPEQASLHRVALSELTDDNQEIIESKPSHVQSLAHLPAETSNKTKFSSKAFGVKGSPRVTTTRGVRKGGGRYQIGKPYTIRGKKYYPRLDPHLKQTGLASWYGPNFHGRLTANGEVYDQYGLSAAHPTMPLPSYAKVTNLENGSSITVRVNDRGPFSKNRVIDLSARAAQLLGYTKQGVAKVKVEYAGKAPLHGLDEKQLIASYNPGRVNQDTIPSLPGRNVVLAQAEATRTTPTQTQIDQLTNVGFAPPVPTARIENTNTSVPRPTGLVNSYADTQSTSRIASAFDFIHGKGKLEEPSVGMKNLVHLKFGPFKNSGKIEKAEQLFDGNGILQRVATNNGSGQYLLVIVAEEQTGKILEAAKLAKISRYSTK